MNYEDIVVGIVALNAGRLVGKTRLQKTVYLLEKCDMNAEFDFGYHNYGPFSVDVAQATDFAVAQGRMTETPQPGYHEVPYFVFETLEDEPRSLGNLSSDTAKDFLNTMEKYSAIDLELAATIAFLDEAGVPDSDIDPHIRELKPAKATDDRLETAHRLLNELGM